MTESYPAQDPAPDQAAVLPRLSGVAWRDRSLSGAEFALQVGRIAGGLHGLGIGPGSTVALVLRNSFDMLAADRAARWLGGKLRAGQLACLAGRHQLRHRRLRGRHRPCPPRPRAARRDARSPRGQRPVRRRRRTRRPGPGRHRRLGGAAVRGVSRATGWGRGQRQHHLHLRNHRQAQGRPPQGPDRAAARVPGPDAVQPLPHPPRRAAPAHRTPLPRGPPAVRHAGG